MTRSCGSALATLVVPLAALLAALLGVSGEAAARGVPHADAGARAGTGIAAQRGTIDDGAAIQGVPWSPAVERSPWGEAVSAPEMNEPAARAPLDESPFALCRTDTPRVARSGGCAVRPASPVLRSEVVRDAVESGDPDHVETAPVAPERKPLRPEPACAHPALDSPRPPRAFTSILPPPLVRIAAGHARRIDRPPEP